MNIEKILSEAPEKATHIDKNGHYFHNSTAFYWLCCDDGTTCVADIGNGARKLSDLREIQRLRAENEALKASFWVKTDHDDLVNNLRAENEALKKTALEQQAIGVENDVDFVIIGLKNKLDVFCDRNSELLIESFIDDLQRDAEALRSQAAKEE